MSLDTELPRLTCPNDTTLLIGPTTPAIVIWNEPIPFDNSGYVTMMSSHSSGDMFVVGDTTVSYQAKDSSENVKNCSFLVRVEGNHIAFVVFTMYIFNIH